MGESRQVRTIPQTKGRTQEILLVLKCSSSHPSPFFRQGRFEIQHLTFWRLICETDGLFQYGTYIGREGLLGTPSAGPLPYIGIYITKEKKMGGKRGGSFVIAFLLLIPRRLRRRTRRWEHLTTEN